MLTLHLSAHSSPPPADEVAQSASPPVVPADAHCRQRGPPWTSCLTTSWRTRSQTTTPMRQQRLSPSRSLDNLSAQASSTSFRLWNSFQTLQHDPWFSDTSSWTTPLLQALRSSTALSCRTVTDSIFLVLCQDCLLTAGPLMFDSRSVLTCNDVVRAENAAHSLLCCCLLLLLCLFHSKPIYATFTVHILNHEIFSYEMSFQWKLLLLFVCLPPAFLLSQ